MFFGKLYHCTIIRRNSDVGGGGPGSNCIYNAKTKSPIFENRQFVLDKTKKLFPRLNKNFGFLKNFFSGLRILLKNNFRKKYSQKIKEKKVFQKTKFLFNRRGIRPTKSPLTDLFFDFQHISASFYLILTLIP